MQEKFSAQNKVVLNYVTAIFSLVVSFLLLTNPVSALSVIKPAEAAIDTAIVQEDNAFTAPSKIVVVPINIPSSGFNVNGNDWARGLYYYLIANDSRPGFTDIPFHYIVTADGYVYEGNRGGDERKVTIEGYGSNAIVVGYLVFKRQTGFDVRAESVLADLLIEVANRNAINPNSIETIGLKLQRNDEAKTIRLIKSDTIGTWQTGLNRIVDSVRPRYNPQPRAVNVEIQAVNLPAEGVNPGTLVEGKITLKNTAEKGLYGNTNAELVATSINSGRQSKFFITGEWLSTTQFGFMSEDSAIRPGESKEFPFKVYVPLWFGEQQEEFELRTVTGQVVANTRFTVKLNINRPEGTIVEIKPTPVGFLRMRGGPTGLQNNETGRVYQGERYFQIDDAGNGYIQIKLPDGRTGWISKGYVKYV